VKKSRFSAPAPDGMGRLVIGTSAVLSVEIEFIPAHGTSDQRVIIFSASLQKLAVPIQVV
jgi:hypothetical protein